MKIINTFLTLITMITLATTDYGWIKAICWLLLIIEFGIFIALFDKESFKNER